MAADPARSDEPRFRLYLLCECARCEGTGKEWPRAVDRCPNCRGEGRTLQRVAECDTPEDLGVAIVTVGREGQLAGCAVGVLDTEGAVNEKWLISPWLPSPRNVSDAARVLAHSKAKKP